LIEVPGAARAVQVASKNHQPLTSKDASTMAVSRR
jgi:hypothetical protein